MDSEKGVFCSIWKNFLKGTRIIWKQFCKNDIYIYIYIYVF